MNGGDDRGCDDKGNNDKDKGDGVEGDDDESDAEAGEVGRGRIRRELCADGTVYERAIGGTVGKARARRGDVTFFELTGNSPPVLDNLGCAPCGWRVKVTLSLL